MKIQKILYTILLMLLAIPQMAKAQTGNWDSYQASGYASGSGTTADPYIIKTAEQLAYFAARVTAGQDLNVSVQLGNDIDLGAHWWRPIGPRSSARPSGFSGHFDGKGYTISSLRGNWGGEENHGFFSFINGGSVKNLIFYDAYLTNTSGNIGVYNNARRVGVLAAGTNNYPTIENIIVRKSKIDITKECAQNGTWFLVGGLVGGSYLNPKYANIYVDVDIDLSKVTTYNNDSKNRSWYGGLLGAADGGTPTIENAYVTGTLEVGKDQGIKTIGAFIGDFGKNANANTTIKSNCYYEHVPTCNGVASSSAHKEGKLSSSYASSGFNEIANAYKKDNNRTDLEPWRAVGGNPYSSKLFVGVSEKYTQRKKETSYSLEGADDTDGTTITWAVEDNHIAPDADSHSTQITFSIYNKIRKGKVTIKTKDEVTTEKTFSIFPKSYTIDLYADEYAGGTGTKDDPYLITNDLELAKLARDVNNTPNTNGQTGVSVFDGKYFKITQDIDLQYASWLPIGTWNNTKLTYFGGKLLGAGHTIKNLQMYWKDDTNWNAWGLFNRLQGKNNGEEGFASVTDLIFDDVNIEKEEGFVPVGSGINIGVVAGELYPNAEIGNIIIKHAKITDNNEAYTTNSAFRVGGIVGGVNNRGGKGNSDYFRIYNLSTDTQIEIGKEATLSNSDVNIAGAFGTLSVWTISNPRHIYPTNIYVHGPAISTNITANYNTSAIAVNVGAPNPANGLADTWYYANQVSGSKVQTYGTQKNLTADFAKTFIQQNNNYLQENLPANSCVWVYSQANGFAFGSTTLSLDRTNGDVITATTPGQDGQELYYWYTSQDRKTWTQVMGSDNKPLLSHTLSLPYQTYDQYVYAILEDESSSSQSIKVEKLTFTSSLVEGEDGTYTVKLTNNIWKDNDLFTITYTWMLNGRPVGTNSESYNPGTITSKDKISCSISITDKDGKDIFARTVYKATVVYLCPAEITINGTTYPAGVDDLDLTDPERGYSPEKPVLTWKGAYSKLEKDASWTENVIVLMGTSSQSVTNNYTTGFNIMPNTQDKNDYSRPSDWTSETIQSSPLFRNTTITGAWNNIDYQGKIEVGGDMLGLHIFGDTRFENITFNHNNTKDYDIIYCQYNNLEMGDSVVMTNYKASSMGYETVDGSTVNSVQVFGGFLNDGRFYPLNTADNIKKMEESMPHGKEGFSITLKSGHYSTICVGGRQAGNGSQNGVMGTPNLPIKCTITVDIDRDFNDKHNDKKASYDVGTILAGNHEGAMYADVDIIVKSGTVARVVNGTLGNQRKFSFRYENKEYTAPYNSYMGRANILIDPASSRFAGKGEPLATTNNRVVVTELYGGSLGRGFEGGKSVDNPFYGLSTVTINGGTFKILPEGNSSYEYILSGIYGAGAGGMTGIGDDNNPTPDDKIAYWNSNKDVMLYGSYNDAKNNLIHYQCYDADKQTITDVDPTQTKTNVVINGGVFGTEAQPLDGIYAGGSGYMSPGLWYTNNAIPNIYGGNVYGKKGETVASLTINGGTFHCQNGIFAGGRGTDRFFTTNTFKSSKGNITIGGTRSNYKELGKTYGNVELTIYGGTFNSPIYGGGYGVADAKEYGKAEIETLTNMARVIGKSTVNIYGGTFYKNIYGGGDMALVEYQGNGMATNVNISDSTDIRGSVFGGGNGRAYRPASDTDTSWGTQLPDSVGRVIGATSVTFLGDTKTAPYIYGDIYGGGNLAQVQGDTYVNLYAGNFAGQIFGGGNGLLWTKDDNVNLNDTEDKVIRNSADITGNTYVNLAQDQGGQEEGDDGKKVDNFSINVIWDKLWKPNSDNDLYHGDFYTWDAATEKGTKTDKTLFYKDGKFVNPHNIYGGGNLACKVSGQSTVNVLKGMTPFALLNTQEWKDSYGDNKNPHFYVFGGGYGPNTSVGSTDVNVDVEGDYGIYDAEIDDNDEQLARPFRKARGKNKARQTDTQSVSNGTINVFDNSKGIPNFTVLGVLGGGYSGIVTGDTKVTVDGNTFIHRVYGGGFGDPESTEDNTTGQIGGNTIVNVQGAHTYGDIFGGGTGVAPKTTVGSSQTTYFTSVARIHGTTKVEISDDAAIYGNVYGGGDMANVGEYQESKAADYYDTSSLISESTLNQETGAFEKYTASGYKTFVNILGGDIYGQVFGGGKGLKKENAAEYDKVGRINGNTLVHVANTDASTIIATQARKDIASEAIDADGNNIPHIWNRIYGGCAYGTVDGNTLVHIEGGMLGLNIFGGGYGNVPIEGDNTNEDYGASTDINVLNQVLGKKDTNDEGTYANILGNTKVQIDGGSWIWNRMADKNGNITKWLDAEEENNQICANLDEFKEIVASLRAAQSYDGITNAKAKAAILKIKNSADTQKFFDINNHMFKKNHNIFGGGNRACFVGTYNSDSTVVSGTGKAVVELNHSPLTEVKNENRNTISLLDCTTLQGLCWYLGSRNVSHPQFSVFGAGYGANTKVAETEVIAHPGSITDENGNIAEVDGKKYRYRNQLSDMEKFQEVEDGYKEDFLKVSREDKRRYYGSSTGGKADGTDDDKETYRRYHATRVAWSMGIPGFIFLEIHGGGCSGYVMGDTFVKTGCQLNCNNLFGAGLGWKPYGTIDTKNISNYDFGSITGNSKVQINSGYFSENVYGGGAGVESMSIDNALVDFPDMARVKGKAEVHVAGKDITEGENIIGSTLVFGSIYGGGDVANVGMESQKAAAENLGTDVDQLIKDQKYTSLVDLQGGIFYSQVFAGGNGRTLSKCADYTKLGGIYGNAFIKVNGKDAYLWNRIYGGCQNGTVYGNTLVSLNEGHIASNVFGGGWGNCDTTYVNNQEVINITSANVTGNTHVLVKGGRSELTSYWLADKRFWEPSDIIDGKTYSPQYNHLTQKFKINHNIYAGGNTACLVGEKAADGTLAGSGNTYLTLTKGLLYENTKVVPGQEDKNFFESDEWKEVYSKPGSPHFCIFGGGYGENATILGDTHVTVDMGRRDPITDFDINEDENYKHFKGEYSLMDIIGGGYNGKVEGDTYIEGEGGAFCRRVFGGGFYNSVNSTNVSIYAIDCHDIFGGGLMGDVQKSTQITIGTKDGKTTSSPSSSDGSTSGLTNADIFIHGSVYGGNDVSGYVNVVLDENGYFADNGGTGTHINIYGGKIDGNVYGAGNGDYLYALDKEGHTKVTVNEYYPLNPNDPESEKVDLVYTVPMRENMPSYKAASDAAKIVNINSWRPLTNKVSINIQGEAAEDGKRAIIKGDVYGGGNSATVQKVQKADVRANETVGEININIGSHVNIGRVFMGCNGDALFTASEDNDFMNKFQRLNGDIEDYSKELNLADTIDWQGDPSNKGISTLWLSTKNEERPLVYPHLLDLYFQPVETDIQGTLKWNGTETGEGLEDSTIGTFCCGGNRGNMNVYPFSLAQYNGKTDGETNTNTQSDDTNSDNTTNGDNTSKVGNAFEYTFPAGLTITDKIVGGCNNANYDYKGQVSHEGGYLLGEIHSIYPFIKLNIKNKFQPAERENAYVGGNVYGGCYKSGTIRGDVSIVLESDMLEGKSKKKLENSNELLGSNTEYSALNVYGAGYGMDSYLYGNCYVKMGRGINCKAPSIKDDIFNPSGTSANFIYGGGQQGNVIGKTDVKVLNGHVFKSVTGGSYSGYVWGSTQIRVGYPKYYTVIGGKGGLFQLNRTDQNNKDIDKTVESGKTVASETIKQTVRLIADDVITQSVYDAIATRYDFTTHKYTEIPAAEKANYFSEVAAATPSIGWDNVNIVIGEAVYGGGYSLAQGGSVMANNTTVLKYDKDYNLDSGFDTDAEGTILKTLGGTTAGFGGNTTIVIGDRTKAEAATSSDNPSNEDRDHITISRQDMKVAELADGQDLLGYYYKDQGTKDDQGNVTAEGTYHYIYQAGTYYKGGNLPSDMEGKDVYEYDNEGGVFGDGHLSYAEGFRSADLTGYGFASSTISTPKILNTFQRLDVLRLTDNCFSLLGARDYATNAMDKTPYSISRVGEIQMYANDVVTNSGTTTGDETAESADGTAESGNTLQANNVVRSRNYMGFANNIHYVGALYSNVSWNDPWHDKDGKEATHDGKNTYQEVKQKYIDDYFNEGSSKKNDANIFEKRNDGTAKNMIGIASGYALKIQNAQEIEDANGAIEEKLYYGPVYGIIEMNLIDVREDEGGGYVYADNAHQRTATDVETPHEEDFLETTGNFVFPYKANQGRYIVDDCFPVGYPNEADAHYWYVTGFNYHYTAHITGYTLDKSGSNKKQFNSNNQDGLVTLSGLKKGQDVNILSWKMYSAHNVNDTEGSSKYECDLENRNYSDEAKDNGGNLLKEKYELYVGASNSLTYVEPVTDGTTTPTEAEKLPGFAAKLGMQENVWGSKPLKNNLPDQLTGGYAKIAFQLVDNVNNSTSDYYQKHLSKPCKGTLVLEARAFEDDEHTKPMRTKIALKRLYTKEGSDTNPIYKEVTNGNLVANTTYYYRSGESNFYQQVEDTSFYTKKENSEDYETVAKTQVKLGDESQIYYCEMERHYTYTIDLTIDYVQGPDIEGNITIENCALPGERIRVKKDKVVVKADQAFSVNGYYWRIGKRKKDANGEWVFDTTDDWSKFKASKDFDTYNQSDKIGKGMFAGCYYDKTEDFLEIPAYYYMNGYGIQLGITMNMPGLDDILPVKMQSADQLTIHNYHRMDPHKVGMDLHLKEAVKRVADEADDTTIKESEKLAEPRIYLADQSDLTAFIAYVDTIGKKDDLTAIQQGAHAQFVLQSDLNMQTSSHDGSSIADFAGTFHGNGHVINGLGAGNCLFNSITGNVYNLGLTSGKISNNAAADGKITNYHCCYEYAPTQQGTPIIYKMDGTIDEHYTTEDFRLGKAAYDLNQYYLHARQSNSTDEDKRVLKYVYDYFANGDYQYAHRTDAITGKNTGITYLRTGKDSDLPNYEQAESRHDKTHAIDPARHNTETGIDQPLFNAAGNGTELMNDFLFWGQSLQSTPANYPTTISSHQVSYMANRVYRTAGYYGNTQRGEYHYNAYSRGSNNMDTYVHNPATTAIDFSYEDDNATIYHDFIVKDGVTQNLLVYTGANDDSSNTDAYDIVSKALSYSETTKESLIHGHHIAKAAADDASASGSEAGTYSTPLLHLVERTPKDENSEGESSTNNNFCAPIPFEVTNHAWYTRKPQYYANDNTGAWEGICLPFTVDKAKASLNGEITHFYGKPSNDEKNNPADNMHNLHHEYWLRGMMKVENENNTFSASFERPGSTADSLFEASTNMSFKYEYNNSFFVDTYGKLQYNQDANRYYAESHTYEDYLPLTSGVPYIVRFPGERYYEFDLSSKFYNNLISGRSEQAQTITFHAFGRDNTTETSHGAVVIPITATMQTTVNDGYGYAHEGIFTATQVAEGSIYGMNADGSAFDDASTLKTVMPFRTFIAKAATTSSRAAASVIKISEGRAIDKIIPEVNKDNGEETENGEYLIVRPIGGNRVRIESTYTTNLNVYSTTGQLYRVLDVRPGTATYSGFYPGIYIFGKTKVLVK